MRAPRVAGAPAAQRAVSPRGRRSSRPEHERLRMAIEAASARSFTGDAGMAYRRAVLQLVRELASEGAAASPLDAMSAAYEGLLAYRPRLDAAGGRLVLQRSREPRRETGSFYTPRPIARMVVEAALEPLLHRAAPPASADPSPPLRILDPAMGTGVFLAEAARYLAARWDCSPAWVAERCLFGIDQDPLAVEIGVLALGQETGARAHILRRRLRCGDALQDGARDRRGGRLPRVELCSGTRWDLPSFVDAGEPTWYPERMEGDGAAESPMVKGGTGRAAAAEAPRGYPRGRPLQRTPASRYPLGERGLFDAVVGNPPWGVRYGADEEARLRDRFGLEAGVFDSFKIFLALASHLSRGTVGMIVPQAVLLQEGHGDIRQLLLDRHDPYLAANLGNDAFPGAAAPACALVFGPRPGPRAIPVATPRRAAAETPAIPAGHWSARGFPIAGDGTLDLLQRLRRSHPTLGERRDLFRVRDTGLNYNRASVARRVMYSAAAPEDPRDLPRYRGRDFARYTAVRASGWLRHDAAEKLAPGEQLSYGATTRALAEKIVLRQTADRIIATLDRSRMVMGRSVIAITREGQVSLLGLLACLNSRLVTNLYRALAGEEGRLLPQVKVSRLLALPLPLGAVTSEAWRELEGLARQMLEAEGQDTTLDARIDEVVEGLYYAACT